MANFLQNIWDAATKKNPFEEFNNFIKNEAGGWGNVAMGAGILAAGILTGGVAAAGLGGAYAGGLIAAGTAAGAGIAAGSVSSGIKQAEYQREAEKAAASAQAEADKANALADSQRRASLYSLRRQVGVRNVGASTSSAGGATNISAQKAMSGIVLG